MAYLRGYGETPETPEESAARARNSIATQFKVFGVSMGVLVAVTVGLVIWSELDDRKHRHGDRR